MAVRTERSKDRTKNGRPEGQYSPVRLELARLVSSLLYYMAQAMLVLNLPAFENKNYTGYIQEAAWPSG